MTKSPKVLHLGLKMMKMAKFSAKKLGQRVPKLKQSLEKVNIFLNRENFKPTKSMKVMSLFIFKKNSKTCHYFSISPFLHFCHKNWHLHYNTRPGGSFRFLRLRGNGFDAGIGLNFFLRYLTEGKWQVTVDKPETKSLLKKTVDTKRNTDIQYIYKGLNFLEWNSYFIERSYVQGDVHPWTLVCRNLWGKNLWLTYPYDAMLGMVA